MWLACYTQEEIAEEVGIGRTTVTELTQELCKLEAFPKSTVSAQYAEPDWAPPLYTVWTKSAKTNRQTTG